MIFKILLHSGGLFFKAGLKAASLRNAAFKKRLIEKDFLMQVKLTSPGKSGYLLLRNGGVKASAKDCPYAPDLVIEWRDAPTALRNMLKIRPKDFVESIRNEIFAGGLAVEFNVASSLWFINTMKEALYVFIGPRIK